MLQEPDGFKLEAIDAGPIGQATHRMVVRWQR